MKRHYLLTFFIVSASAASLCTDTPSTPLSGRTQTEPAKKAPDTRSYVRRVGEELITNIPHFMGMLALMYTAEAAVCYSKKQPYVANHKRNLAHAALITPLMNRFALMPGLFMLKESASNIGDSASTKQLVIPLFYGLATYTIAGLGAMSLTGELVGWDRNAEVSKKMMGAALAANILLPAVFVKIDEWSKKSLNVMDVLEDEGLFSRDTLPVDAPQK